MKCNVLTMAGGMVGLDLHIYNFTVAEFGLNGHLTAGGHFLGLYDRVSYDVTAHGAWCLQQGFQMLPVVHVPIPLPPGPWEAAIDIFTSATGTSQPQLAYKVINSTALLFEPFWFFGFNVNCGIFPNCMNVDTNILSVTKEVPNEEMVGYIEHMALQGAWNTAAAVVPGNCGAIMISGFGLAGDLLTKYGDQSIWTVSFMPDAFTGALLDPPPDFNAKLPDKLSDAP